MTTPATTTFFYPIPGTDIDMPPGVGRPGFGGDHGGVDITAAYGTPIYAAFGGTIKIMQDPAQGGWGVYVYADDGSYARYWHMYENGITFEQFKARLAALGITEGARVAAGQVIGQVGHSGNAAGDHLHFSIYDANNQAVDPSLFNYTLNVEDVDLSMYWTEAGYGEPLTQLALGDQGPAVRALQQRLAELGFNPGPIDGIFGAQTQTALRNFQATAGFANPTGLLDDASASAMGFDLGAYTYTGPEDTSPGTPPSYSGIGALGVMGGGSLVRVQRPGLNDLWAMVYEFPTGSGQYLAYQFSGVEQVAQTFGQGWETRIPWTNRSIQWYQTNADVVDDAMQVIGQPGNFTDLISTATASLSSYGDPSLAGIILNDPEVRAIMVAAAQGGWDYNRQMAALRQTDYWQNTLYPGISSLYGVTSAPEAEWQRYYQSVQDQLVMLGLPADSDGSYRSYIGQMLDAGIDDAEFLEAAPIWERAATNADYFRIMQQWVARETDMELTFDNWFDLIEGTAPAELMDIANRAAVQYQAEQTGFDIGSAMIENIAENTLLSEREIAAAFNEAEKQLLSLGTYGLKKYGLTRTDLVSAATGIKAPSGRSHEWIRQKARQAAIELSLLDDEKAQLFVGYRTDTGVPQRQGMVAFSPEGA